MLVQTLDGTIVESETVVLESKLNIDGPCVCLDSQKGSASTLEKAYDRQKTLSPHKLRV